MRFSAILCDPAWRFVTRGKSDGSRGAEKHYSTSPVEAFKRLPIADVAEPNCALFMWTSWPYLEQALDLGRAWGFTYKTCAFTWVKPLRSTINRFAVIDDVANWHVGTGYWTRANAEICLLFTRGRVVRLSKAVRELIVSPVGEHSAKPLETHTRIEQLVSGPYLELFARRRYPNWVTLGNEIDGLDLAVSLPILAALENMRE